MRLCRERIPTVMHEEPKKGNRKMNILLLIVALISPVDTPKADMKEAAVAPAAVASEAVLPTGSFVKPSESVVNEVCGAAPSEEARANAPVIDAALPSEAAKTTKPVALDDIKVVKESEAQPARILPESRADSSCNLADLYRRRFLSGPWSVTRRLEAAKLRGDTEEVERLTAMLEEVLGEALEVEGTEP